MSVIKTSELIKDDNLQELADRLESVGKIFEDSVDRMRKKADQLNSTLKNTNPSSVSGRDSIKKSITDIDKLRNEWDKLENQQTENEKVLQALKLAQQQQRRETKLQIKLTAAAEGSYDALSAQYSLNKLELNAMSAAQRENTKEGQQLEKQTAAIYEEMKRLQEATGKHSLNVGNYTNSIVAALKKQKELHKELQQTRKTYDDLPKGIKNTTQVTEEYKESVSSLETEINNLSAITGKNVKQLDKMEDSSGGVIDALGDIGGAAGVAGKGVQGLGTKFKALLRNPIVLLIATIVGGLALLFNAFRKSEKGVELMTKATGILNGIMSSLVKVSVDVMDGLVSAFENPQEAIKDLGQFLLDQIVNRFKAIVDMVNIVGGAFKKLINGDFEGLKQSALDAGQALLQFTTGFDVEDQKNFIEVIKETTKEINKNAESFTNLATRKREVQKANIVLKKQAEELRAEEEKLQLQSEDVTRSLKERQKLALESREITKKRAELELRVAKNNIAVIQEEINLRAKNGEDILALNEQKLNAFIELKNAEKEYLLTVERNLKDENELRQDILEQSLDILIDGFDKQKTINERIINDESRLFTTRKRILEETIKLADTSFKKQVELVEKETGVTLNANELINESDAEVLRNKFQNLGLSEIITKRLLEMVNERKLANQDLLESETKLYESQRKSRQEAEQRLAQEEELNLRLRQQTEEAVLKTSRATEIEIQKLRLKHEKEILLLKLKNLKSADIAERILINQQIDYLNQQIKGIEVNAEPVTIWDMFGLDLSDEAQQVLNRGLSSAIASIQDYTQKAVDLANQRVQAREQDVRSAESALQREISNRNAGYASNVEDAQRNLDLAKENQEKALEQRRQAQLAQLKLDTALQASNLITAASQIWRDPSIPFLLKLGAIGTMFGSFAASKVKAFQLVKEEFAEGDFEIIGGGRHGSGKDTLVGMKGNKAQFAEQGEARMILPRKATNKYKSILPTLFHSLKSGTFERDFLERANNQLSGVRFVNNTDLGKTEKELTTIRKQGEQQVYWMNGKKYVKRGNRLSAIA